MVEFFKTGILTGFRQWRIALMVYGFQLLLAATLGVQVFHVLEASIGNSLELDKLLGNYDHTVISDLFNVHGASISPLLGQLRWLVLIYFVFSIFINGGLLYAVVHDKRSGLAFWKGGALYYFRFLRLGLFFLLITGIISALIWLPFLGFFMNSVEYFSSEKISVWLLCTVLSLYLLILGFLFVWSLVARIKIIGENSRIWPAIKSGLGWALRRYFPSTLLVVLFFGLHILLFFFYWMVYDSSLASIFWLVFFVLVQQGVAFLRVLVRVMVFGGVSSLYNDVKK
ncbi:MAG: hypothetical protein R2830_21535 [Saprospiraceae bacterium]